MHSVRRAQRVYDGRHGLTCAQCGLPVNPTAPQGAVCGVCSTVHRYEELLGEQQQRHERELQVMRDAYRALQEAVMRESNDIEQILGKALGYPRYKDDPKNFPGSTEQDGVCVGDHVAASLAMEAAALIQKYKTEKPV